MRRRYAVGEHYEAFIEEQVRSGRYEDAEDVVRAGLRLLESQEDVFQGLDVAEIRRSIEAARERDVLIPADEVFDRLERKFRAMVGRKDG